MIIIIIISINNLNSNNNYNHNHNNNNNNNHNNSNNMVLYIYMTINLPQMSVHSREEVVCFWLHGSDWRRPQGLLLPIIPAAVVDPLTQQFQRRLRAKQVLPDREMDKNQGGPEKMWVPSGNFTVCYSKWPIDI